jgi:hypothetical protein
MTRCASKTLQQAEMAAAAIDKSLSKEVSAVGGGGGFAAAAAAGAAGGVVDEAGEKAIEQWKIKKLIKSLEQARGYIPCLTMTFLYMADDCFGRRWPCVCIFCSRLTLSVMTTLVSHSFRG